jgi:hypothetical protein
LVAPNLPLMTTYWFLARELVSVIALSRPFRPHDVVARGPSPLGWAEGLRPVGPEDWAVSQPGKDRVFGGGLEFRGRIGRIGRIMCATALPDGVEFRGKAPSPLCRCTAPGRCHADGAIPARRSWTQNERRPITNRRHGLRFCHARIRISLACQCRDASPFCAAKIL